MLETCSQLSKQLRALFGKRGVKKEMVARPEQLRVFLFGKRGTGKDTVARYLVCQATNGKVLSISQPLYQIAFELFGATQKDRRLLQILGDKLREIDQDCLLKKLLEKIDDYQKIDDYPHLIPDLIVVNDVRLVHEADVLRQHGFLGVKVVADDPVRLERLKARGEETGGDEDLHITEREVDLIAPDWVLVNNDCTLAELKAKIDELYHFLLSRRLCTPKGNQP